MAGMGRGTVGLEMCVCDFVVYGGGKSRVIYIERDEREVN